jgi:hypothetical protein
VLRHNQWGASPYYQYGPSTLGNVVRNNRLTLIGPQYTGFGDKVAFQLGSESSRDAEKTSTLFGNRSNVGNVMENNVTVGGRRGILESAYSETVWRKNNVTVDDRIFLGYWIRDRQTFTFAAQPLLARLYSSPIIADGNLLRNEVATTAPVYVKESGCTFTSKLIPLQRGIEIRPVLGPMVPSAQIEVHNAGVDSMAVSASSGQAWIKPSLVSGSVGAANATFLKIVVDPALIPAGTTAGKVRITTLAGEVMDLDVKYVR